MKYLAIGSLPSAIIANLTFYYFFSDYYNEHWMILLFGFILILIPVIVLIQLTFTRKINSPWRLKLIIEKLL